MSLLNQYHKSHQELAADNSEVTRESTLSSNIEEDDLNHQQDISKMYFGHGEPQGVSESDQTRIPG
jgi:coproporphyrinogen III oxidase-like Fe-S oxidoreductase